jgi:L-Ala-D/L-Glu epimerase
MQITRVKVTPVELKLLKPAKMAGLPAIDSITAIFVRLETKQGLTAWGCTVANQYITGETAQDIIKSCQECAELVPDLHPIDIEYSLDQLTAQTDAPPAVICAFDLAFHDLLGLAAGLPLYRILGGYRTRIQTSATIPISTVKESVELACGRANQGFRMLKVKGGLDVEEDVQRIRAIHRALPDHILRLDADGAYSVRQAMDLARALENMLEMLEQPTAPDDFNGLRQLRENSPIPILADQSLTGPESALGLASAGIVNGLSIKLVSSGGLRNARQIDAIARAAKLTTMVGCFIEPALLISAGLSLALSSPNVAYCDLDGYLDLVGDPSQAGFELREGWLVASDVPGLGYQVDLG